MTNRAVREYVEKVPSREATQFIQTHAFAANAFKSEPAHTHINKLNEDGKHLLDGIENFAVFVQLIEAGANVKLPNKEGFSFFSQAVAIENSIFLKHILSKKILVSVLDFTPEEQIVFWITIGSEKTAKLLIDYKFNPNIANEHGNTPLTVIMNEKISDSVKIIEILLAVGADPYEKNKDGFCAFDFYDKASPEIQKVFDNYEKD